MPADPASVTCPECNKKYKLSEQLLGKKIRCKNCNTMFRVPAKPKSKHVLGELVDKPTAPKPSTASKPKPAPVAAPDDGMLKLSDDEPLKLEDDSTPGQDEESYDNIPKDSNYMDLSSEMDSRTDYSIDLVTDESALRLKKVNDIVREDAQRSSPLESPGDLQLSDEDLNSDGMFDLADDAPKPKTLAMGDGVNMAALAAMEDQADDGMSFASDEQPPQHHQKCPSCGAKMSPGAVVCVECGYNMNLGKRMGKAKVMSSDHVMSVGSDKIGPFSKEQLREYYVPGGLCAIGMIIPIVLSILIAALGAATGEGGAAILTVGGMFMQMGQTLVVNVVLMVIIAYATAALMGVSFGNLFTAMLKFAGISMFMSSAAVLVVVLALISGAGGFGLIVGLVLLGAAQIALLVNLFEDVGIGAAVIFCVIQYVIGPLIIGVLFALIGLSAMSAM